MNDTTKVAIVMLCCLLFIGGCFAYAVLVQGIWRPDLPQERVWLCANIQECREWLQENSYNSSG